MPTEEEMDELHQIYDEAFAEADEASQKAEADADE